MNIDLRKFVDINIKAHVDTSNVGTRDTVVLFTDYGNKDAKYLNNVVSTDEKATDIVTSFDDAKSRYLDKSGAEDLLDYLKVYFDNGGKKVSVKEGYSMIVKSDITSLPDEYICIASTNLSYSALEGLADDLNADTTIYGIKEKLIFARTTSLDDALLTKNFVVKYSSQLGAEMSTMAYLSKIDVYKIDSVYDYAFTQETLKNEDIDDVIFDELTRNNINVNVYLANASRVCGGNCKDGEEITNTFVKIILQQTLTNRLVSALSTKLKSTSGLSTLYTVIAQEMRYYLNNGYLTTDKIWSDDTLVISKNGQNYEIIEKGTPLIDGYIVKILPMSSLTDEEKRLHKAPEIYLIIADQYAIRKITLNGEVI